MTVSIIPEDKKHEILNDLYLEGYSEEYLFPGYSGVTQSIENKVRLDKILHITYYKLHDFKFQDVYFKFSYYIYDTSLSNL